MKSSLNRWLPLEFNELSSRLNWSDTTIRAGSGMFPQIKTTKIHVKHNSEAFLSAFVDPFSIAGVFTGHQWFQEQNALCHIIGSVCLVSCVCSLWSIAAISVNRYILLCHQPLYKTVYTWKNTILMCVCLWIGAFCLDLPNFLDWGDHTYDMKTMACSYDRLASYSYTVFFITMFVTAPLFIVLFCNVNIYITVVKSKMRVSSHVSNQTGASTTDDGGSTVNTVVDDDQTYARESAVESNQVSHVNSNPKKDTSNHLSVPESDATKVAQRKAKKKRRSGREIRNDIRLAKTLFIVFIAFCLCWAPYALICLIDKDDNFHKAWYAFSILMAHASSTLNSILYAVTNRGFRDGYKKFLKVMFCRASKWPHIQKCFINMAVSIWMSQSWWSLSTYLQWICPLKNDKSFFSFGYQSSRYKLQNL